MLPTRKKMPISSDTADAVTPGNCRSLQVKKLADKKVTPSFGFNMVNTHI